MLFSLKISKNSKNFPIFQLKTADELSTSDGLLHLFQHGLFGELKAAKPRQTIGNSFCNKNANFLLKNPDFLSKTIDF